VSRGRSESAPPGLRFIVIGAVAASVIAGATVVGVSSLRAAGQRRAAGQAALEGGAEVAVPRAPLRTPRGDDQALVAPEVPPALASAPALTAVVQVVSNRGGGAHREQRVITRTAARIHVEPIDAGREWLLTRNPVDPRRMTGILVDQHRQALVEYDEVELFSAGLGRGWADVVGLGAGPDAFERLAPTGRSEQAHGMVFSEYRATSGTAGTEATAGTGAAAAGIRELWWNAERAIFLRVAFDDDRGGVTRMTLEALRPVDSERVRDPRDRFPSYAVWDVADFREKTHDEVVGYGHHDEDRPWAHGRARAGDHGVSKEGRRP
jgi:hypothetical protein